SQIDESWKSKDWLDEYQLLERSGKIFESRDLNGHVHVVSFFFASCPGPCTRQNNQLAILARELGPQGVTFLSITCDPKRDTPPVLKDYAAKLNADPRQWLFLTGDLGLIRRVGAEKYSVPVDEMTHTEKFLVYDRWGQRRGHFNWNKADELNQLRLLVDQLLKETEPPAPEPSAPATDKPAAEEEMKEADEAELEGVSR
ncbi:MAG: SCO family protein, partial [Planctomycetota bacterium]